MQYWIQLKPTVWDEIVNWAAGNSSGAVLIGKDGVWGLSADEVVVRQGTEWEEVTTDALTGQPTFILVKDGSDDGEVMVCECFDLAKEHAGNECHAVLHRGPNGNCFQVNRKLCELLSTNGAIVNHVSQHGDICWKENISFGSPKSGYEGPCAAEYLLQDNKNLTMDQRILTTSRWIDALSGWQTWPR